ncbi:DNA-binding transcriptional regulator, MarR family [Sphingomonas guangdongensis]|uniref:DNA-binding transcriptional regulator, MarR family n=1 Tax=Sphingomonas guangdongensis TaxID=1141890 RepID=A0A285QAR4_9SPHN|nr:MarR family winged helix-turn-helix transcriptional regulator [Sphingomonas guangdongensis]SOB78598.1 DNA-binding transcriptional regulator, MarR family [Sphingomonas guangdongensis]
MVDVATIPVFEQPVLNLIEQLRAIVRVSDARVSAAIAAERVSVAEWRLLSALHAAGAVPPSMLAETLGLTRGGTTRLIDRLRARRLVVRAGAGGTDRRYQTIALTGAGAVLVRHLAAGAAAAAALTDSEHAILCASLDSNAG